MLHRAPIPLVSWRFPVRSLSRAGAGGPCAAMANDFKGLDGRSREVLASVIVAYIESAVPVSSRQLTKGGKFGLSSASLRNAMADLEDLGFLALQDVVDALHVLVGQLLDALLGAVHLVGLRLAGAVELLEVIEQARDQ